MNYQNYPPSRRRGIIYSRHFLETLRYRNLALRRNIRNILQRPSQSVLNLRQLQNRNSQVSIPFTSQLSISPIHTSYTVASFSFYDMEDVKVGLINKNFLNYSKVQKNKDKESMCVICQDDIKLNDIIRTIECSHSFHIDCIDKWYTENKKCPICKFEIE